MYSDGDMYVTFEGKVLRENVTLQGCGVIDERVARMMEKSRGRRDSRKTTSASRRRTRTSSQESWSKGKHRTNVNEDDRERMVEQEYVCGLNERVVVVLSSMKEEELNQMVREVTLSCRDIVPQEQLDILATGMR